MELFKGALGFEWDAGNREKNLLKHRVTMTECEEVFFDPHKRIVKETLRTTGQRQEQRYIMIGKTSEGRGLYLVFTLRRGKIRVISARDLNRKERGLLP
jgi:uncharacterized protein